MKRHLSSLAVGMLGFALMWGGWHLYLDHQAWHGFVNAQIAAQQRIQDRPVP